MPVASFSKKDVIHVLDTLSLLPTDLIPIVVNYYWMQIQWQTKYSRHFDLKPLSLPCGIVTDYKSIYISDESSTVLEYSTNAQLIRSFPPLQSPWSMDIDHKTGYLYVLDNLSVTILNTHTSETISSWKLPITDGARGLKFDNDLVYLTIAYSHYVYVYNVKGNLVKKFGTGQSTPKSPGIFAFPNGITVDETYLYVLDHGFHRLQVVDKLDGKYEREWGGLQDGFINPRCIYLSSEKDGSGDLESLLYIGDQNSIHIFTKQGVRKQKISEFGAIYGICVCAGELFVTERAACRIMVFQPVFGS